MSALARCERDLRAAGRRIWRTWVAQQRAAYSRADHARELLPQVFWQHGYHLRAGATVHVYTQLRHSFLTFGQRSTWCPNSPIRRARLLGAALVERKRLAEERRMSAAAE